MNKKANIDIIMAGGNKIEKSNIVIIK